MYCGIQFGHRMKNAAIELCELWQTSSIILGPRNFPASKYKTPQENIIDYAKKIKGCAQSIYIDPQLFAYANPAKHLRGFDYWKACKDDFQKNYAAVIEKLCELNAECSTTALILPAVTANKIDDEWKETQNALIDAAKEQHQAKELFATIALTADILRDIKNVDAICLAVEKWDAAGVYVVCERPQGSYLTDDTLWILNLVQLVAGLKLAGKKVFVGYSSHQQLLLVLAKCDAIFSGNYLNMRRFRTYDFGSQEENGPSRHTTWYYAPQTLSEYRVVTLDVAHQQNSLHLLTPPFNDKFAGVMFKGAQPSNTAYNETASFLHYLDSLHAQCEQFSCDTYEETFEFYTTALLRAEKALDGLRDLGIYDSARSFKDVLSANVSAANAFNNSARGFKIKALWEEL